MQMTLVQMTLATKFTRLARTLTIGALAIGAATMALPSAAEAGSKYHPREVSERLDRIAYNVERIPEIRGPRRQHEAIDRLQQRLHRLDRITGHQRGRRARSNDVRIERLQHRLRRMERQVAYRTNRRDDRRTAYSAGRDDGPYDDRQYARWKRQLEGK